MINFKSIGDHDHTPPQPTVNGLRLINPQGRIGMTWWSQQWLSLIDGIQGRTAIEQGRRYARRAQITAFDVTPGQVIAKVQGTEDAPYTSTITWAPVSEQQWVPMRHKLIATMEYMAELMASQMPRTMIDLFQEHDAMLFPQRLADLQISCTCGEEVLPCKHLAATLFLFADRMDADPFDWLHFRGAGRNEILGDLFGRWGNTPQLDEEDLEEDITVHRLPIASYWQLDEENSEVFLPPTAGSASVNVIKRLGFPPFFPQGDRTVMQTLEGLYED